jgi:hypothetical protein
MQPVRARRRRIFVIPAIFAFAFASIGTYYRKVQREEVKPRERRELAKQLFMVDPIPIEASPGGIQ